MRMAESRASMVKSLRLFIPEKMPALRPAEMGACPVAHCPNDDRCRNPDSGYAFVTVELERPKA